jgi:hypothetical protein
MFVIDKWIMWKYTFSYVLTILAIALGGVALLLFLDKILGGKYGFL